MNSYDGITGEAFWLLGQNKFNNSKEFYEANKEQIVRLAIQPMRQIAEAIAAEMEKIDDRMNLVPTKMVSRIRRDTRFSKDKRLYRENIWIMFMRPKAEWPTYPCFWFEIQPSGYSYGVSCFETTPAFMQIYRQLLLEQPDQFLQAVKKTKKAGADFYADTYKKEKKPDVPENIKMYYNVKSMSFMAKSNDLTMLESDTIIAQLKAAYENFTPMYRFLKCAADRYIALGQVDNNA